MNPFALGGLTRRRLAPAALVGIAVFVTALVPSDRGRSASDPLPECADYAAALSRCFGERRTRGTTLALALPPSEPAARDAARERCQTDHRRLERACR